MKDFIKMFLLMMGLFAVCSVAAMIIVWMTETIGLWTILVVAVVISVIVASLFVL